MSVFKKFRWLYDHFMLDHFHKVVVDRYWLKWKGYKVNWEDPRDINEKIQWLICCSDTSRWVQCADKYRVREFVESKALGDMLIPLLGVWNKAEDIDFDSLPDKFVIKCNHDSGSTKIVDKSSGYSPDAIREFFANRLNVKYGFFHGEVFYNQIKPLVIAEPYLSPVPGSYSISLVDYKIWCFDGRPYSVWTCHDRVDGHAYVNIYDLEWHVHPECSVFTDHYRDGGGIVPRPVTLDKMLEAASVLSEGFPEVRIDFYEWRGKAYFGEMTFSTLEGKIDFYTQEYLEELGRQCVLPKKG